VDLVGRQGQQQRHAEKDEEKGLKARRSSRRGLWEGWAEEGAGELGAALSGGCWSRRIR
jgi:hypothetical protein